MTTHGAWRGGGRRGPREFASRRPCPRHRAACHRVCLAGAHGAAGTGCGGLASPWPGRDGDVAVRPGEQVGRMRPPRGRGQEMEGDRHTRRTQQASQARGGVGREVTRREKAQTAGMATTQGLPGWPRGPPPQPSLWRHTHTHTRTRAVFQTFGRKTKMFPSDSQIMCNKGRRHL